MKLEVIVSATASLPQVSRLSCIINIYKNTFSNQLQLLYVLHMLVESSAEDIIPYVS